MFRRSVLLDRVGLIDEELPRSYGEDYDILLRASEAGLVTVVNQPLVRVLWNGQSYYFGQWASYAEALQYLRPGADDAVVPLAVFAADLRARTRARRIAEYLRQLCIA